MKEQLEKLLKYLLLIIMVIAIIVPIYGFLVPWPPIKSELAKHPDSFELLTGVSYSSEGDYNKTTKSYVLLNTKKFQSQTVSLTIDSKGNHELIENEGGFITMLMTYGILVFLTYWFWFRKTHNKSLKREHQKRASP